MTGPKEPVGEHATEDAPIGTGPTARSGDSDGRAASTRERVIGVVVELLEDGGEAALSIDEVRDRSGVSVGSIYHHFGDRNGLIVAAQIRRFARFAEAEIAALSTIVERADDVAEFRRAIRQLTRHTAADVRIAQRWGRIGVLGSSIGRPALMHEVRMVQTRLTDDLQAHIAQGQARGFFRNDLDPRAIAVFVEAYSIGVALNDLDEHQVDERDWETVVWAALDGLITDD